MIEMRRAQLSFGDGLIAEEVSDLREDWMKHADAVLADQDIVAAVYEALARRHAKSRSRGRRGAPAEVVLRLLIWAYRRSRPPIPTDRDHLFRTIATSSAARVLTAPLDDGGDVSLLGVGQARREAVPVVNRRDPRATRRALTADAAARAGGPC